jgi:uncharacterized protein (TIRG00374 family)
MIKNKTILWVLKLCIGLALLSVLIVKADYGAIIAQLSSVNLLWLAAMFVVPHITLYLSTVKWQALLKCHGSRVGIVPLLKFYLIGTFFNNFLPSMIGGDIVRIHQLRQVEPRTELAIASTFLERFIGFGGLVTLLPLVWLYPSVTEELPSVTYVVVGAILAYIALFCLLFSSFDVLPATAPKNKILNRAVSMLRKNQLQIRAYRSHVGVLVWSYVLSLAFYLLSGVTMWLTTQAVGASVSLGFMISVQPLVLLVASIPISVNGLGLLESGTVLFLTQAGISLPEAVSVTILLRIRIIFTALLGGLLFLLDRRPATGGSPRPGVAETEADAQP